MRSVSHARRRRAGRRRRETPSRHHRARNRGDPHRTALRVRKGGRAGRAERPRRQLHDEPQSHPRPCGQGAGAEDRPLFLRDVVRRAEASRREDRLSVRGETPDVVVGQRPVARQRTRRAGARLALWLRRVARRHPRADYRGVHPLRQRDHAAHRNPEERPDALLPADRPCAEGRGLPRKLPVAAHRARTSGRSAAHGGRRHRSADRRRAVGRGVLPEPRKRGLLLRTLAAAPRYGHGDAGRHAEPQ